MINRPERIRLTSHTKRLSLYSPVVFHIKNERTLELFGGRHNRVCKQESSTCENAVGRNSATIRTNSPQYSTCGNLP